MRDLFPLSAPIPITLPHFVPGEAAVICALLDAGAPTVHIRKPDATPEELDRLLRQLDDLHADFSRLIVHHDIQTAMRHECGGLHLREGLCPPPELPLRIHTPRPPADGGHDGSPWDAGFRFTSPAHSWDEALRLAPHRDYVLLSPLFDSVSKPGYRSGLDPAEACRRLRQRDFEGHVVALGGITPDNIGCVRAAGFDGAAVLGSLWAPEPHGINLAETVHRFRRLTRRWRAAGGTVQFISDGNLDTAGAFLAGGGRWIQLRMKEHPEREIIARGRELRAMCHRCGAVLIINDNPSLVEPIGADGVHLGQGDLSPVEARRSLGEGAIIGCTANTFEQIARIADTPADYIGLGPFRYTTTKKNLSPLLGREGYADIMSRMAASGLRLPVVAIGGIGTDDVPEVMTTGVSGIALSGAISHAGDVSATTAEFLRLVHAHRTVLMP